MAPSARGGRALRPARKRGKPTPAIQAGKNYLQILPGEILTMIFDNIQDRRVLNALAQSCRAFYPIMQTRLYRSISVETTFVSQIPKFIRQIEPVLSICQKKQLKTMATYRGQQEDYPPGTDEAATPSNVTWVQQLLIGYLRPGRKHNHILQRYVEEVAKNLINLEFLDTTLMTKPLADSIASFNHLTALGLKDWVDLDDDLVAPLMDLRNLRHFSIEDRADTDNLGVSALVEAIIRASAASLESLRVITCLLVTDPFTWDAPLTNKSRLPALKSFAFSCAKSYDDYHNSLKSLIDFTRLSHLHIGLYGQRRTIIDLFEHLAKLSKSASSTGKGINLRHLSFFIAQGTDEEESAGITYDTAKRAAGNFVSDFDELMSLYFEGSGDPLSNSPETDSAFLRGTLKHKNLRSLRIGCNSFDFVDDVYLLSADDVGRIIDGLPLLCYLEFAPELLQVRQIGLALARGACLTTLCCYPLGQMVLHLDELAEIGWELMTTIVEAFLDTEPPTATPVGSATTGNAVFKSPFVWEQQYALTQILTYPVMGMISSSAKRRGDIKEVVRVTSTDGTRHAYLHKHQKSPSYHAILGERYADWPKHVAQLRR